MSDHPHYLDDHLTLVCVKAKLVGFSDEVIQNSIITYNNLPKKERRLRLIQAEALFKRKQANADPIGTGAISVPQHLPVDSEKAGPQGNP